MSAGGTPGNVVLGPGRLYVAPLGTAEPTGAGTALPSAWSPIGYTEEGSTVETELSAEDIEVAEELDPIKNVPTGRRTRLTFTMVEATVRNLALSLGAGSGRANSATPFELPDPSVIVPVMFAWDSAEDPTATGASNRRWIFRKCSPSGTIALPRRKAPAKTLLAVTFNCSRDDAGLGPVKVIPDSTGRI